MPIRRRLLALAFACLGALPHAAQPGSSQPGYPPAPRLPVVDTFHGRQVADPYRWLEDLAAEETQAWVKAQDDLTRERVSGPTLEALRRRLDRFTRIDRITTPIARGDRYFYFTTGANGLSGRVLKLRQGASGPSSTLIDRQGPDGNDLISLAAPSPDGRRVAYGVQVAGSRFYRLRLLDVDRRADVPGEALAGLHTSAGPVSWELDGRAFYYVRFAAPTGDPLTAPVRGAALMRHRLGEPQTEDRTVLDLRDDPRRWYAPQVTEDGRFLVVLSGIGAAVEQQVFLHDLQAPAGGPRELFPGRNGQFAFLGSHGGRLFFSTTAGAPHGRIVAVAPHPAPAVSWQEVLAPAQDESLTFANLVGGRLIVMTTADAAPRLRIHDLAGRRERDVPLPPLTTVWGPGAGGVGFVGRSDGEALFAVTGVADPGSIYRLDPASGRTELFLRPELDFDPRDFVGEQVFFTSRDGTRVPMFIARHKDTPVDGRAPVLMYGYGAFGWSAYPWFQPQVLAFLESGGIYALPCLRGGGEYGEAWHLAAVREKKQTSVDDYVAAAEWLIAQRYAPPGGVVANGGSASGAVAAAATLAHPELFAAALIDIPALDLLRYDRFSGAASWIPEFGDPQDPEEFAALRQLSPYHNLQPGRCYPPTLVLAGERDSVTVPSHAYKFVAALQNAQGCANPVHLLVAWGAGHTFGKTNADSAESWAVQLAFVAAAQREPSETPPPPRAAVTALRLCTRPSDSSQGRL